MAQAGDGPMINPGGDEDDNKVDGKISNRR